MKSINGKNKTKHGEMESIFSKLSEENKDILILVAKGMKIAQEAPKQPCPSSK